MNKRSVKSQPAKASHAAISSRGASPVAPAKSVTASSASSNSLAATSVSVADRVSAQPPPLRAHKFRVGQTVLYTSSPVARPGASGTYKVVKLLPSDGDDYQYRIKNPDEAFERVAKESQLESDH